MQTAAAGGATSSGGSCTAGTATASDALAGVTFPDGSGGMTTGTMTNVGAFNLTGAFSAGYVSSLTGLAASSVCSTTSLLGSAGTAACVTGSANATLSDVASGKTFWNAAGASVTGTGTVVTGTPDALVGNVLTGKTFWNAAGAPVTGTMANNGTPNLSSTSPSAAGYYAGFTNGSPTNSTICNGTTILGTAGNATCVTGTPDAVVGNVLASKTFWNVAGAPVTGTMTNQGSWSLSGASALAAPAFPGAGYYSGITNAPATTNYCAGTYINGSNGTALCAGGATTGTTIAAGQVCTGYSGYNLAGSAINGSRTCTETLTPASISGLKNWYRADSLSYLSNGANVMVWRDDSGNGNDVLQPTLANRPTYQTNVVNSKAVVRYDGATSCLKHIKNIADIDSMSILAVAKSNNAASGTSQAIAFHSENGSELQSGNYAYYAILNSSNLSWYQEYGAGVDVSAVGSGTPATNSWALYRFVRDSTAKEIRTRFQNTTQTISYSNNADGASGANNIFYVGCNSDSSGIWNGDIAEVIVYDSALTGTDLTTVECYLSTKYALGVTGC